MATAPTRLDQALRAGSEPRDCGPPEFFPGRTTGQPQQCTLAYSPGPGADPPPMNGCDWVVVFLLQVLDLSNGIEEVVNPENVWNGIPKLDRSPSEV